MEKPIGRMIKMIDEALARRINAELQEHNLTFGQAHMLVVLSRAEEKTLSLKELEQQFCFAQSTIAGLAARLEKKGLVESLADESDRRVKRIRLTASGADVCRRTHNRLEETEQLMVAGLSAEETAAFRNMLDRVLHALNGSDA